ncbi:MAG: AAA family ATPase [Pelagibacteraceae bacterium]|nr:AAA family ATPase [Pelagibacteraceae bacterium]MCI5079109.1 AAA family ATPase [Pelagibacteraceae bacterium]
MIKSIKSNLNQFIIGNDDKIELSMAAIIAGGSILLEDQPGTGKTTFAKLIANSLGLDFKRIQFTSDMLPSDINGFVKYINNEPNFQKGPIFSNIILADELNRGNPKCQSAFMEAMEEKSVTIDGSTHNLPQPFFVIATQNPTEQVGTYPLPESQLDRFMISFSMNKLNHDQEKQILKQKSNNQNINLLNIDIQKTMNEVNQIECNDIVISYIQSLTEQTKKIKFETILSTRTLLYTVQISKALAYLNEKKYVTFDEVQKTFPYILKHRIKNVDFGVDILGYIQKEIIEKVPVPR